MLKNIKLIVTDLDGTVLHHGKLANDIDKPILQKAIDKNIHVTIATGQPYKSAKPRADLFDIGKHVDLAVLANGALISKISNFEPVYVNKIDNAIVNKMVKKLTELNVCTVVFTATPADIYWNNIPFEVESMIKRNWFERFNKTICSVDGNFNFIDPVQIMIFVPQEKNKIFEDWFKAEKLDNYLTSMRNHIETIPIYEFTNITATKGTAIKKMAEILNVDINDVVVFGDNMNDITMFEEIPNSVAVGNAVDEIKQKAKYITDTNINGGVGQFIEKYILN
ncbi:HAD family hydrolase [Mycoplasma feriruminatoris]|uniref:5-amino-6-(5-phospho-D-ribitylamino)uracil phosphatase YcsE n=1 Tax=Mycoplasma feriruminatoris TaxID=1179777 RepID=A0AAX3TF22_9MOLU|nr:HAD family hydrolase [Mycoplasma feriruminatoris]WFQ92310.1 5-amino-6-(5-phospho-D-ribitylamino)uracil phosphatase YcsE [Mycoplasma feriruminatoris]